MPDAALVDFLREHEPCCVRDTQAPHLAQALTDRHIEPLIAQRNTYWAEKFAANAHRAQADLETYLATREQEVRELVNTLAEDLDKAEPKHFSIGLMRLRVKQIRTALGGAA